MMSARVKYCFIAILAGTVMFGMQGLSQATSVYNFDFQTPADSPEVGYTHIDENTAYTAIQGYGLTEVLAHDSRFRGTGFTTDRRVRGFLKFNLDGGGGFQVDLPNGDYLVTAVLGDPDFASIERLNIEGVTYGLLNGGGATVAPAGANVTKLVTDGFGAFNKVAFVAGENSSFGKVSVLAGEYLMLDAQPITVTDGQLNFTSNGFSGSNGFNLNYIDIVHAIPEPATSGLMGFGVLAMLLRRRKSY